MSRNDLKHLRDLWDAKRAEAERAERLEQCTYCGDVYDPLVGHVCDPINMVIKHG